MKEVERDYVDNVGHPPRTIEDPEGQWDYTGTPAEKEKLRREIAEQEDAEVEYGQPSLF
jgi:hypothetical protein